MKLGLLTTVFHYLPLEEVLSRAEALGYEVLELPARADVGHLDIDRVLTDTGYVRRLRDIVKQHNLEIAAIAAHRFGKLVLGPLGKTTDGWAPSNNPEEKVAYGVSQMKRVADAAEKLGVPVVTGFTGSSVWEYWYTYPDAAAQQYEAGWELFAERWWPIIRVFEDHGIRFATEVHPGEMAYNLETAERAVQILDSPAFGLNLDPSHFVWQSIDPVIFIKHLASRIYHVHAKDGELQTDELPRSGVACGGAWDRIDRGFRFRTPGWGQIPWRRVISALADIGYSGPLCYEHEDTVMSGDDGVVQCARYLAPLLIKKTYRQERQERSNHIG